MNISNTSSKFTARAQAGAQTESDYHTFSKAMKIHFDLY